jgi:hypothetical protein
MSMRRITKLAALFLCALCLPAVTRADDEDGTFTFLWENDAIAGTISATPAAWSFCRWRTI